MSNANRRLAEGHCSVIDGAGLSPETELAAHEILGSCRIVDIRPTRIQAELTGRLGTAKSVGFEPTLEFQAETGRFANRFSYHVDIKDAAEQIVATIEFVLVLDWDVPDNFTPDESAANFVTGTTSYFAAFPYARELLQSLSARLGLDSVVLGPLFREHLAPEAITTVRRGVEADDQYNADARVTLQAHTEDEPEARV
jgi:hypothetical protein